MKKLDLCKVDIDKISDNRCFSSINGNIHTSNIIGEDEEFYYTVPVGNINKVLKDEIRTNLKEILTENIIWKLENNIKISKNKHKEVVNEILENLEKTHAEYFI